MLYSNIDYQSSALVFCRRSPHGRGEDGSHCLRYLRTTPAVGDEIICKRVECPQPYWPIESLNTLDCGAETSIMHNVNAGQDDLYGSEFQLKTNDSLLKQD